MQLLEKVGLKVERNDPRKLVVESEDCVFYFSKPFDVPVYVEHGIDMGIAGSDVVEERGCDLFIPLELPFGRCRLSVIAPRERVVPVESMEGYRVGTKYPGIASRFFSSRNVDVEIIRLNGSVELAPIAGIADVLVDIVDTGRTLAANDLVEVEKVVDVSALLLVNRIAQKVKFDRINEIIHEIKRVTENV
ncbi:MAG: phosphoribosyltransferase [Thermotogota bacterium]|nr:phosphoribosyltransferase [Thermotogota bacterium]MDK2864322.1 phosphoribosyltransferase [Thermotogota bacterium]